MTSLNPYQPRIYSTNQKPYRFLAIRNSGPNHFDSIFANYLCCHTSQMPKNDFDLCLHLRLERACQKIGGAFEAKKRKLRPQRPRKQLENQLLFDYLGFRRHCDPKHLKIMNVSKRLLLTLNLSKRSLSSSAACLQEQKEGFFRQLLKCTTTDKTDPLGPIGI